MIGDKTNYCKDGQCSKCGRCCGNFLALDKSEIRKIRDYIRKNGIKAQKHPLLSEMEEFVTCPFLDCTKEDKCTIYPVRPNICKAFICDPNLRDDEWFFNISSTKQFIGMRETFFENAIRS